MKENANSGRSQLFQRDSALFGCMPWCPLWTFNTQNSSTTNQILIHLQRSMYTAISNLSLKFLPLCDAMAPRIILRLEIAAHDLAQKLIYKHSVNKVSILPNFFSTVLYKKHQNFFFFCQYYWFIKKVIITIQIQTDFRCAASIPCRR